MAETYIYDQDCDDFATLGLCGRLDRHARLGALPRRALEAQGPPDRAFFLIRRPGCTFPDISIVSAKLIDFRQRLLTEMMARAIFYMCTYP